MRALRGLEMLCLSKSGFVDIAYAAGKYTDSKGEPIDDLMDMGCMSCGAGYYTREQDGIEFCPACGWFERKKFKDFQALQAWSNEQNWSFLKRNGMEVFAVTTPNGWRLAFAAEAHELTMKFGEVHVLRGAAPPPRAAPVQRAPAPPVQPAPPQPRAASPGAETPPVGAGAPSNRAVPPGADPRFANLELD